MSEEGLFKKQLQKFEDISKSETFLGKSIAIMLIQFNDLVEDAKKALFESMPKYQEMHLHPIEDSCGDKEWVRIPFEEWKALMNHWTVMKKWFGGGE